DEGAEAAPGGLPREGPARPQRPDHPEAQGADRLGEPAPPLGRLVGAVRREERGDRRRRLLLVQAIPGRPRLPRLARGPAVLRPGPARARGTAASPRKVSPTGEGAVPPPEPCPDPVELRRFRAGELPEDDARRIGRHLAKCTRCAKEDAEATEGRAPSGPG